jgi:hypothetical protein
VILMSIISRRLSENSDRSESEAVEQDFSII